MASVNKVILIGNLGSDPEVRYTQSGSAVANLSVATNEKWTDKDGNRQERTEWHNVTVWGKQAEHCGQYLSKGRSVYVEGRIQSRTYTDRDGNDRKAWDVVAQNVTFLSGEKGGGQEGGNRGGGGNGGGWGGNSNGGGQRQGGNSNGGGQRQGGNGGGWGGNRGGNGGSGGGWGGNRGSGGGGWGGRGSQQQGGNDTPDEDPIPF